MSAEAIMSTQIGLFEAKTKLSELVRKVDQGERFTITVRGRVVAELGPPPHSIKPVPQDVIDRLMHPSIHGISGDEVLEMIREGRK
jgi:antitoxin (DNA-binding transcriptional repressor) of toxin-antitoxin stability system